MSNLTQMASPTILVAEWISETKPCRWCKRSRGYCTVCGGKGTQQYARLKVKETFSNDETDQAMAGCG